MTTEEVTNRLGISYDTLYGIIKNHKDSLKLTRVKGKGFLMLDITEEQYKFFKSILETKKLISERKGDFIKENIQEILDDNKRDGVAVRYSQIFGIIEQSAKAKLNKIAYEEKLEMWRQDDTRTNFKQEHEND